MKRNNPMAMRKAKRQAATKPIARIPDRVLSFEAELAEPDDAVQPWDQREERAEALKEIKLLRADVKRKAALIERIIEERGELRRETAELRKLSKELRGRIAKKKPKVDEL